MAVSEDGVTWNQDRTIDQTVANPLITGSASSGARRGTNGPTQVIWLSANASACATAAANFPWNCAFVMVYRTIGNDPSQNESLAIAGSSGPVVGAGKADVEYFDTPASPIILSPSGWHSHSLYGQLRQIAINTVGSDYQLWYSGTDQPTTSNSGLGLATSTNGLSFNDLTPGAPSTPNSLFNSFAGDSGALLNPIAVNEADGAGHDKVFFRRQAGTKDSEFLAYTGNIPANPLTIQVSSPTGVYNSLAGAKIDLFVNDTAPYTVLFDNAHCSMTIDGLPVRNLSVKPSVVWATNQPGFELTALAPDQKLADGPHALSFVVSDSGSNVASASAPFTLDSTPTTTTVKSSPQGNVAQGVQLAFPGSLGTFTGETHDTGASSWNKVVKMRSVVTNPLNQVREYVSSNGRGWTFSQDLPANSTTWRWVVPVTTPTAWFDQNGLNQGKVDPFYAFPGSYTVTIGGVDLAGNIETPTITNTTVVQVV